MNFIPSWVNLLPEKPSYSVMEKPMTEALKRGQIGVVAGRLLAKLKHKNFRKSNPCETNDAAIFQYVGDYVTPLLPKINQDVEYDLCISFLNPHNIGLDKVRAKKRLAWIHTDYSTISIDVPRELKVWGRYDYISSISPNVTDAFLKTFPHLSNKIIEIENIMSSDLVKSRSNEFDPAGEMTGQINLLSVGRLCEAKNYDNVPDIAHRIINMGINNLKWYIIGAGGCEELIKSKIKKAGMENHVFLLGKRDNPYPYIKACDIYVQPSRYEGKSITVREAQILGKSVVVTSYPTAASQINNGVDGVIVPLDNEGCARGIAEFIVDKALQQRIIANLAKGDFAHESEVNKIYKLLEI